MSKPTVTIITVNYNTANEVKRCLQSIINHQPSTTSHEIIAVDNASTDGSAQVIRKFKNVKLVQNKENLGFAKANNIGAKVAKGEFLFFLNPDTQIKNDTISKLLEFAKEKRDAITGPKILNPDGSTQGSCYNLPKISGAIREYWFGEKGAYEKFAPKVDKPTRVKAIVGAAMFMSKEIFERLGGFNEHYFLYYEDLDLCRKAKKLQIPVYYFPKASIIHSLGISGGNLEHLKKSAQVYHGFFEYLLIISIIKIGQWLKF